MPESTLLDLACGTGEIAIPLSSHFHHVIAVDQEPSTIDVGRRKAAAAGAGNMTWDNGTAEAITLQNDTISLIVIGNTFHRLDRSQVARKAMRCLEPGTVIAILNR